MNSLDQHYTADMLDALSDIADEQELAMRESEQDEWDGVDKFPITDIPPPNYD
jgi:hypothetical protein